MENWSSVQLVTSGKQYWTHLRVALPNKPQLSLAGASPCGPNPLAYLACFIWAKKTPSGVADPNGKNYRFMTLDVTILFLT
jgi:hypothetical protein